MTDAQQRAAAKQFAADWQGRGDEKQETQAFWLALLQKVFDVAEPEKFVAFELPVKLSHTSFIDGYIGQTRVLIEQKGRDIDLRKGYKQSDGSLLTPFGQARRYAGYLPHDQNPRWIVVCNFQTFEIHDMNRPNDEPETIALADLEKEYYRLQFLVDTGDDNIKKEMEISLQAGELVGALYDALLKQYKDPSDPETLKSLNMLCVRLVFCLYAEDAGIFGNRNQFHDYLHSFPAQDVRRALIDLFLVLDTKPEDRDPYMDERLAAFPYVNGGLFADEKIIIPRFDEQIVELLLHKASEDFDWSAISPTIFGAVFESTLNPETRRSGGMHYTSIENIHKVIDPLFLNGLRQELAEIKEIAVDKAREKRLKEYQTELSRLTFLDPAAGSGNFLTETYLSLRRLENEVLGLLFYGQVSFADESSSPIKVSIGQFYGIEINDFAVTVAKTALWIAESQMLKETEDVVHMSLDFLPLKSYANIAEGNALRMDWADVVPKEQLNYIMGNPPFVGGMYMSTIQKDQIRTLFDGVSGAGEFDYVTGWYQKASQLIEKTTIRAAFVSTNSICQGSQVITFWKHLIERYHIHIDFAYTTFVWNNEAKNQAKVHCIIVGFSESEKQTQKLLYTSDSTYKICEHISPYLTDTPAIFVESRSKPLCDVPPMRFGNMPRDGGGFVLSPEERKQLIREEPDAEKWIKPYIGAVEFLNGKERYCLWLVGADPGEISRCPTVKKRVEFVRETRAASKAAGTRKFADTPTLFCQISQPHSDYIIVPKTSSGKRKYIPLGFADKDTIASDLVFLIPDAGMYEFGVLMSNVHNAWMRLVAGRLKSDYRYAKDIVYNNFPWPAPSKEQKDKIVQTATDILNARALYPKSTLSNLYDDTLMPPELRKAHQANDRAVMAAYGFNVKTMTESTCVAELMKLYQVLTQKG
ncbi:MAG: class I SAM-dependent DNA methyltransferase [Subdoligranulum sp.]|nr:class I SAM-dependent DNA methyltransferase [Subdoligranulum sp.]